MHRVIRHFRSNLIGWLALFVALGGTGYAAVSIPRNSVGAAQIRDRSIIPVKLNPSAIGGSVRAWAIVRANGSVIAGAGKPTVATGAVPGSYEIQWETRLPRTCATVANVDERSPTADETPVQLPGGGSASVLAGYVSGVQSEEITSRTKPRHSSITQLNTFNQSDQPTPLAFDVAVIC